MQEETAPPPAPEPVAEYREPAPDRAASALRADIPTLSQLTALRSEDAPERERREAAAYEYPSREAASYDPPSRPRVAEQPPRRSAAASAVLPRQKKPATRYIRAVAVPEKEEPVQRERPSRREEDRKVTAADIPTLSQLSFLREEAEAAEWEPRQTPQREDRWEPRREPQWEPERAYRPEPERESRWETRREPERDYPREFRREPRQEPQRERQSPESAWEEPDEPARPSRAFTAADIPSLTSLQRARETADRDEYEIDETPMREEFDAPARSRGPENRTDRLPTVAQLRAQLEEEKLYGNLAFQDSVRQIKQVLTDPAPAPQPAEQPVPRTAQRQSAAPQPTAQPAPRQAAAPQKTEGGQKVHFIPYEDFLKEEDFDDFSASGKNGDAGSSRPGGRNRANNAEAEAKAFRQKMAGSQRQRREETDSTEQDAELKKKRDPKILYWISSLRRTS